MLAATSTGACSSKGPTSTEAATPAKGPPPPDVISVPDVLVIEPPASPGGEPRSLLWLPHPLPARHKRGLRRQIGSQLGVMTCCQTALLGVIFAPKPVMSFLAY